MPTVIIDGVSVPFEPGEKIIQVAKKANNEIPHYCYHDGLSIVAQCRMCLVEAEGQRKLVTACSTPCTDGMKVNTKSEKVKKSVAGVQEFLLANHPLDCPICDQAGECSLQEYSYKHGQDDSRFEFFRRTYIDVDMGPSIKKNMNRCIHCTRCIRYCDEVGHIHEMIMEKRGNDTEIITIDDKPLRTAYAGGLADVCPVGSLTTKDFRFKKRVWYLKENESICDGCSKGCNILVSHENGIVYRLQPKVNMDVNQWWLCDEGRYGFHHVHSPSRILGPTDQRSAEPKSIMWAEAVSIGQKMIQSSKKVAVLFAGDSTQEEVATFKRVLPHAEYFSFSKSALESSEDKPLDHLLRRSDKSPNLKGLEQSGVKSFKGFDPRAYDLCLFVSAGKVRIPYGLAKLAKSSIGLGVFLKEDIDGLQLILPGLSTLEKAGTFVNHQGRAQSFQPAILPLGLSRPIETTICALVESTRRVG